jgi:biotin transport system substrate-specific component
LGYILGPTGGYLFGFILSAYIIGLLAERGLERNIRTFLLPFLAGTVILYALGAGWLAFYVGPQAALAKGARPSCLAM